MVSRWMRRTSIGRMPAWDRCEDGQAVNARAGCACLLLFVGALVGVVLCACDARNRAAPPAPSSSVFAAGGQSRDATIPSSRLAPRYVQGDDGSRFPTDPWDTKLKVPCQFSLGRDGKARCYPHLPEQVVRYLYQDADCQRAMVEVCAWGPSEPRIAAWRPADRGFGSPPEHAADYAYGLLGARVEWPKRAYVLGGRCVSESTTHRLLECNMYTIDRVLTPEDFAAGSYVVDNHVP